MAADESRIMPECSLLEAARRAGRTQQPRAAVAVHLARLEPPGPRPHHRRVSHALLEETARPAEGQLFSLANGDLVLLCNPSDADSRPAGAAAPCDPEALVQTFIALFRADMADPARIATYWHLPAEFPSFMEYVTASAGESGPVARIGSSRGNDGCAQVLAAGAIASFAANSGGAAYYRRAVGVRISRARDPQGTACLPLRPIYQCLSLDHARIATIIGAPETGDTDPYLTSALRSRLSRQIVKSLAGKLGSRHALDIAAASSPTLPVHLGLLVSQAAAADLVELAVRAGNAGVAVTAEIDYADALNDAHEFHRLADLLNSTSIPVVLAGVPLPALTMTKPWLLPAAMLKLACPAHFLDNPNDDHPPPPPPVTEVGGERTILANVGNAATLRWGMANGIERFEGPYVSTLLAAAQHQSCPAAATCAWERCVERIRSVERPPVGALPCCRISFAANAVFHGGMQADMAEACPA